MKYATVESARLAFAERIRELSALRSSHLVRALATVPREDFLGPGPWRIFRPENLPDGYELTPDDDPRRLYANVLVALDEARHLNNGEPAAFLRWLGHLDLEPGVRFLHIGCGVGYYIAIAAVAVSLNGRVRSSSTRVLPSSSPPGSMAFVRAGASWFPRPSPFRGWASG